MPDREASPGVPRIACVGRTNEGKTSVVAALTENDQLAIADAPGTTRRTQAITCRADEAPLLTLFDTPGFEDADGALSWMQAHSADAAQRPAAVHAFIEAHAGGEEYQEECELLRPIVHEGASILYVVDGSHPFSRDFEAEMEILRWCGRPRMALINPKAGHDHVAAWRRALDQYFSIVRVFDAHHAPWSARLDILTCFRAVQHEEVDRQRVDGAISLLQQQHERRPLATAEYIADLLIDEASMREERSYRSAPPSEDELRRSLCARLEERWRRHQADVEALYRHHFAEREVAGIDAEAFTGDLFSDRSWELFGLSRGNLAALGAMVGAGSGAPLGGVIDLHTGGASFLAGTVLGSMIGGGAGAMSALFAGRSLGAGRVLGQHLGSDVARYGPVGNPRFPWIVLDLALLHAASVMGRSHARRDSFVLRRGGDGKQGVVERLPSQSRQRLQRHINRIRKHGQSLPIDDRRQLVELLQGILADQG